MAQEAVYELKVLEGKDSGKVIPLEGSSITLGRSGGAFEASSSAIQFEEPSVARTHAMLNWNPKENLYYVSNRSPISPVKVDGTPAASGRMIPGTRLQLGQLVVEVLARPGAEPTVTEPHVVPAVPPDTGGFLGDVPTQGPPPAWLVRGNAPAAPPPREHASGETTAESSKKKKKKEEAAPAPAPAPVPSGPRSNVRGHVEVVKGAAKGTRFEVTGNATIGRNPDCTIALTDNQVSRLHCGIEFEDEVAFLVHHSKSSNTKVGRTTVKDRHTLLGGEEITLADRVVLRWEKG